MDSKTLRNMTLGPHNKIFCSANWSFGRQPPLQGEMIERISGLWPLKSEGEVKEI